LRQQRNQENLGLPNRRWSRRLGKSGRSACCRSPPCASMRRRGGWSWDGSVLSMPRILAQGGRLSPIDPGFGGILIQRGWLRANLKLPGDVARYRRHLPCRYSSALAPTIRKAARQSVQSLAPLSATSSAKAVARLLRRLPARLSAASSATVWRSGAGQVLRVTSPSHQARHGPSARSAMRRSGPKVIRDGTSASEGTRDQTTRLVWGPKSV
jgi:hypothetical protein